MVRHLLQMISTRVVAALSSEMDSIPPVHCEWVDQTVA